MSSPVSADLSATSPSAALGDPSAAQPPQIGIGSRGSSRRRSHGLLSGDLSRRGVKAPFSSTARERAQQAAHAIRKEPEPQPAPQAATPADRPRTPAGAPADRPRQIPKTGRTERYRDAMRAVLGKDAERQYHGMPAASQDVMNKIMREHGGQTTRIYDEAGRATMQDHLDFLRGNRKSQVGDAVRRAREARDAPPEDKGPIVEHGPRQRPENASQERKEQLDALAKATQEIRESKSTAKAPDIPPAPRETKHEQP